MFWVPAFPSLELCIDNRTRIAKGKYPMGDRKRRRIDDGLDGKSHGWDMYVGLVSVGRMTTDVVIMNATN